MGINHNLAGINLPQRTGMIGSLCSGRAGGLPAINQGGLIMNTQSFDNEYPDIAINTVARYAGVAVLDVLTALGQKLGRRLSHTSNSLSPFQVRHSRALHTVAKYSGIDVAMVVQSLGHAELPVPRDEFRHTDKAA
jgi:hypothetical protein